MTLNVNSPASNSLQDAFENKLCDCSGTVLTNNSDLVFSELRIWGCDPTTGTQHSSSGTPDVTVDQIGAGGEWGATAVVPCRAQANPTSNNSSLLIQVEWLDMSGENPVSVLDPPTPASVSYKAKIVSACGGGA